MGIFEEAKKRIKMADMWYIGVLGAFLMAMFYFGRGREWNYREIIICFVIAAGLFVVLGLKMWTNIEFYQFAFIFILIVGILSLAIQPILNAPDETTHFARAEWVSRGNMLVSLEETEYETIQSVKDLQDNVKKTYIASDIKGEKIDDTEAATGHMAAINASFLYIPQAIGILIAKILRVDAIWMMWLARLGNLLFYALGVSFALKIAPKFKCALFFVSVLPMSIQQAASCSADAMINLSAILVIAYFIHLYCVEEKKITWKHVSIFFALSAVMAISKVTNICIAGLILLVPAKNFKSKRKAILVKCMIIGGVIALGGLYYLYTGLFPSSQDHIEHLTSSNVNSSEQLQYILNNFSKWFHDFGLALMDNSTAYVVSLGTFGWLEYSNSFITLMTMFMFGKVSTQEQGLYISKGNKVLIFLMVLGTYAVTCFAMYLSWSPVGGAEILGIQGRYFIPMLALMPLLFAPSKNHAVMTRKEIGDITAMLCVDGAMLIATALLYY